MVSYSFLNDDSILDQMMHACITEVRTNLRQYYCGLPANVVLVSRVRSLFDVSCRVRSLLISGYKGIRH